MDITLNGIKGAIAIVAVVVGYLADSFSELVVVLVFLMIFDYITGIMASYFRKDLESGKGALGIFKKAAFMLLVILGFFFDFVISYLAQKTGFHAGTNGLFGIATCCWLIGTESLSIIENLGDIGVPIPGFLKGAFTKLKDTAEDMAAVTDKGEKDKNGL